jgi:hypothetical protein
MISNIWDTLYSPKPSYMCGRWIGRTKKYTTDASVLTLIDKPMYDKTHNNNNELRAFMVSPFTDYGFELFL